MGDAPRHREQLELMLFRVNGVLFGSELSQVAGVFAPEENTSDKGESARLDDFFGKPSDSPGKRKFIKLKEKSSGGSAWGFLAEDPEDIANISIDDIRPLPAMTEKLKSFKSIWGSFLYKDEIGLLLDLPKLGSEIRNRNASV